MRVRALPGGGPRPGAELLAEAREEGLSEWTLRRARERLGGLGGHSGFTVDGAWVWKMPAGEGSSTAEPTDRTTMSAPHEDAHLATPHIFHIFHAFGTGEGERAADLLSSLPLSTTAGEEQEGSNKAGQPSSASALGPRPAHMHEDVEDVEDEHPSDVSLFELDAHLRAPDARRAGDDGMDTGE